MKLEDIKQSKKTARPLLDGSVSPEQAERIDTLCEKVDTLADAVFALAVSKMQEMDNATHSITAIGTENE